jgi:hypothetical protein
MITDVEVEYKQADWAHLIPLSKKRGSVKMCADLHESRTLDLSMHEFTMRVAGQKSKM